jgi:hypothetical protein
MRNMEVVEVCAALSGVRVGRPREILGLMVFAHFVLSKCLNLHTTLFVLTDHTKLVEGHCRFVADDETASYGA